MRNIIKWILLLSISLSALAIAAEPIKIVYYDTYRPRSWNDNGVMRGMLVDIVNEAIGKRMNIPVIHEGYPWKRAQNLVKNGHADAFVTVPTAPRRLFTNVSNEPVIQFTVSIIARPNHPKLEEFKKITTLKELKGLVLADYLGNGWAKRNLKDMNIQWLPDIDKIFKFLAAGRADAIVASKRSTFDMKRLGFEDKLVTLPNKLATVSFHLCINKNSTYTRILNDFDTIIREMRKDGTIQRIEESYY